MRPASQRLRLPDDGARVVVPADALTRCIEHREIFHDEMLHLMRMLMRGELPSQIASALLMGLRVKKETIGEITAAAQVMREFATPVITPNPIVVPAAAGSSTSVDLDNGGRVTPDEGNPITWTSLKLVGTATGGTTMPSASRASPTTSATTSTTNSMAWAIAPRRSSRTPTVCWPGPSSAASTTWAA